MFALAQLIQPQLRLYSGFRSYDARTRDGADLATLRIARSPLTALLDRSFVARLRKLDFEGRDLETVWRFELRGKHVADVVHLFPHNLKPQGSPPGRGFEVRMPSGEVLGFSDQEGRFFSPKLLYRDGTGQHRVSCTARSLRSRLAFESTRGEPLMDCGRPRSRKERWQVSWLRPDLDEATRLHLAGCLLIALLWKP